MDSQSKQAVVEDGCRGEGTLEYLEKKTLIFNMRRDTRLISDFLGLLSLYY